MRSRWWGLGLLVVALGLYAVGIAHGALLIVIVAGVVEIVAWVKFLVNPRRGQRGG